LQVAEALKSVPPFTPVVLLQNGVNAAKELAEVSE
jgi:ketopantoate reductase